MSHEHYDAVVIGAGQSGGPMTSALTSNGLKTALIEQNRVGGSCVNWGCTPTKTMIASARVAHVVSRSAGYGVEHNGASLDFETVRQRKRDVVDMFHSGSLNAIESTEGLDLIRGTAAFSGERTITIDLNEGGTRTIKADRIFINTGTRNTTPPIDGLESVDYLDSTSIMELDEVPSHLLVLGGGYIGLEFAQMFRRFGAEVTILQRGTQLLKREDEDIAGEVQNILEQDGIRVLTDSDVEQVSQDANGEITICGTCAGESLEMSGSHLLVATGRRPNTDMLAGENTGLELDDNGFVPVNHKLETNVPGIWAMGDVNGGPQFTHISYDDYRLLVENLFNGGNRTTAERTLPYVVFIDPELGRVGMTEREARERGCRIKLASMPMESVARAIEMDETRGVMKAVIDADTDKILGAAVMGVSGGEVMAVLQLAMATGTRYQFLRDMVLSHPTVAEGLNNLFSNVEAVEA